jgi:hypothetical protein
MAASVRSAGEAQACACGALAGSQSCLPDSSGFDACMCTGAVLGDGTCGGSESASSCPADCTSAGCSVAVTGGSGEGLPGTTYSDSCSGSTICVCPCGAVTCTGTGTCGAADGGSAVTWTRWWTTCASTPTLHVGAEAIRLGDEIESARTEPSNVASTAVVGYMSDSVAAFRASTGRAGACHAGHTTQRRGLSERSRPLTTGQRRGSRRRPLRRAAGASPPPPARWRCRSRRREPRRSLGHRPRAALRQATTPRWMRSLDVACGADQLRGHIRPLSAPSIPRRARSCVPLRRMRGRAAAFCTGTPSALERRSRSKTLARARRRRRRASRAMHIPPGVP